jgi:hypothetical protein
MSKSTIRVPRAKAAGSADFASSLGDGGCGSHFRTPPKCKIIYTKRVLPARVPEV